MATLYIPDPLHTEVYNFVSGRSPDAPPKKLLKHRNEYINAAIREKLDRDDEERLHG